MENKLKINALINAEIEKVWDAYTNPVHIVNWNFADVSWHCPSAENDLKIGGKYKARMEAKDGSFGFDFEAIYTNLEMDKHFTFEMDNREVNVNFVSQENNKTIVQIAFDPENENSLELQQNGWQAILNNFKTYVEQL